MTTQQGMFTVNQALEAGFSQDEIKDAIERRRWIRLRRGVLSTPAMLEPGDLAAEDAARVAHLRVATADYLCLRGSRLVVLSHESSALLHRVRLLAPTSTIRPSLTLPPGSPSVTVASHLHRAALPSDAVEVRDGLSCTSAARTVVDLGRSRSFRDAVVAADSALYQRLVTHESLAAAQSFCGRWPGRARARRALDFADGRAQSPYESLARVLCAEQGLPTPEPQVEVIGADGRSYWADLGWKRRWTLLEVDGFTKYTRREDNDPDRVHYEEKLRAETLTESGYEIVRMSPTALLRHGGTLGPRVWAAMSRAAKRHGGVPSLG